jgi:hypothetical protein
MMNSNSSRAFRPVGRSLAKEFRRQFLLLMIVPIIIISLFQVIALDIKKREAMAADQAYIDLASFTLERELEGVRSDIILLRSRAACTDGHGVDAQHPWIYLDCCFLDMAHAKPNFDQIRYIDREGLEKLRVNSNGGRPTVVPEEQLQDKSGRYYFTDGMAVPPGEIYMSQMDLNVERGQIELPHKADAALRNPHRRFIRSEAGCHRSQLPLSTPARPT